MYFKKLIGKKCCLSPVDINDTDKFCEWLNDPEVTRNLVMYSGVISAVTEKSILENLSKTHTYSIIDIESNNLIGNCGYMNIDNLNQTADAGIFIGDKNYWNRGYGTEALSLLADYGFKALNLHNIFLKVYSFNKRAIRSYEKVGFKIIGIRRESLLRDLERHDEIYMDLTAKDFYKK